MDIHSCHGTVTGTNNNNNNTTRDGRRREWGKGLAVVVVVAVVAAVAVVGSLCLMFLPQYIISMYPLPVTRWPHGGVRSFVCV